MGERTREQLELFAANARDDLEALRASTAAEIDSLRVQLEEAHSSLGGADGEKETLREQVRSTQTTHAALLADHNQLVAQHRRAEAQIQLLEAEVDTLRANEMRLLPDLQRSARAGPNPHLAALAAVAPQPARGRSAPTALVARPPACRR